MDENTNVEKINVRKRGSSKSWSKATTTVVILLIIFGIGYYFLGNLKTDDAEIVDSSKYQAVFLTNGQTYFGKISNLEEKYVKISDVYYIVLRQPLQSQRNEEGGQSQQSGTEYTLIKLGKELHGPTSMSINRDHILFVEDLSDDSKIVQAIYSSNQ